MSVQSPADVSVSPSVKGVFELERYVETRLLSDDGRERPRGGFLRSLEPGFPVSPLDVIVPGELCRANRLEGGEVVEGLVEAKPIRGPNGPAKLIKIQSINGRKPVEHQHAYSFERLSAVDPYRQLQLEVENGPLAMRIIDLFVPIGFGQRALVVAPPRTGKTILVQQLVHAISNNHPAIQLLLLLVGERPEDITDMERGVSCQVVASGSDREAADHVRLAGLVFEHAKRLVETGQDVVILLDSLTHLARSCYIVAGGDRRSDELDLSRLAACRDMFRAARCVEDGGSLTVIGTLLAETGSPFDEAIRRVAMPWANARVTLSGELASQSVWPAIDLSASQTERADLIYAYENMQAAERLRRVIRGDTPPAAMKRVLKLLREYEDLSGLLDALGD